MEKATKIGAAVGLLILTILGQIKAQDLTEALRLTLGSGSYSDQTVVRFLASATDGFDNDWDAYKLRNGGNTPNFYSVMNNTYFTVNAMSDCSDKIIPLNIEVAFSGTYYISAEELGTFDSITSITLIDLQTNIEHDIRSNTNYNFEATSTGLGNRFLIKFKRNVNNDNGSGKSNLTTATLQKSSTSDIKVYSSDNQITVEMASNMQNRTISIYDLSGNEVLTQNTFSDKWVYTPSNKGMYIVKILTADNKYYSNKVAITNQ